MQSSPKKTIAIVLSLLIIVVVAVVTFAVLQKNKPEIVQETKEDNKSVGAKIETIGTSVQGRKIESHTYGNGTKHLVFVGGLHGGYEWNSVSLAYQLMDYLDKNISAIPASLTVTIIPSANPDGVYKVVGKEGRFDVSDVSKDAELLASARFNANEVDLNRNFDCDWKPEATWRSRAVSAGTEPFSEPESKALQQFLLKNNPAGVIFWHSQANTVYAGDCKGIILPETLDLMNTYASASGYLKSTSFDSYPVSGASDGWLSSIGIPTLTVELKTHETVEFEQNLAGVKALLDYFDKK